MFPIPIFPAVATAVNRKIVCHYWTCRRDDHRSREQVLRDMLVHASYVEGVRSELEITCCCSSISRPDVISKGKTNKLTTTSLSRLKTEASGSRSSVRVLLCLPSPERDTMRVRIAWWTLASCFEFPWSQAPVVVPKSSPEGNSTYTLLRGFQP